jgi:FkbM family methyltransferase
VESLRLSKIRDFHCQVFELNHGKWFVFDQHLSALYLAILRPGSIAVDGGANIGFHTLQMAQAVLPGGLVMAIEPAPETLARLDAQWLEYRMPEEVIRRVPQGLSSTVGEADFYQLIDPAQHPLSSLRNRDFLRDQQVKKIRIELTTLDTLCKDLERLDFLKLDLEGAEMDALRGGMRTLERFRPVVALEQDQSSPQYYGYTWNQLLEYFASLNYKLYDLFGLHYSEPSYLDDCAVSEFVGVPEEYSDKDALFGAVRRSMEMTGATFPPTPSMLNLPSPPAGISPDLRFSAAVSACVLDHIGAVHDPLAQRSVHVSGGKGIRFSGWAVDEPNQTVAGGVDLIINQTPYRALYGWQRMDVAAHFKHMAYQSSGYLLDLPPGILPNGKHVVSLRTISYDKTSYYQGPTVEFTVHSSL